MSFPELFDFLADQPLLALAMAAIFLSVIGSTIRGGLPRAMAVKHVEEKHGVNRLACICAIDRATLPPLMEYWVPGVEVTGVHELVGNALVMKGEKKREVGLRGEPLKGMGEPQDV